VLWRVKSSLLGPKFNEYSVSKIDFTAIELNNYAQHKKLIINEFCWLRNKPDGLAVLRLLVLYVIPMSGFHWTTAMKDWGACKLKT
jgi:hypothetical protein